MFVHSGPVAFKSGNSNSVNGNGNGASARLNSQSAADGNSNSNGNAQGVANFAADESAPSSPEITKTVRTFFPETWLWDLVDIG